MKIITAESTNEDPSTAVKDVTSKIKADGKPNLVIFSSTVAYDVEKIYSAMKEELGDIPFQGGTSCAAVMTSSGYISEDNRALGAVAFFDDDSDFGVGSQDKGGDPKAAAKKALEEAIDNADRSGELPSAVWLVASPGGEEVIIEGLKEELGNDFPLIGGSSADNTIEGHWKQFSSTGITNDSVTLVAIFDDTNVLTTAFSSGYDPSENIGTVTKAGDRVILEIDNQPAAEVYNKWANGAIDEQMKGGQILGPSNIYQFNFISFRFYCSYKV